MSAQSSSGLAGIKHAGVWAALSYSLISITITLFNKAVLSSYKFNSTLTLTLLQGLVTVLCLSTAKWKGWVTFPSLNWATVKDTLPLALSFMGYVVVSLISLGRVNVPMFTALRRLTVVFVMIEEYYFFGTVPSRAVVRTVVVMMIGATIAAWRDLTFDPVSYFYLFLTNLFTSLYTVYINVVKKKTNLNVFGLLYYNNISVLPLLFVAAWATGDLSDAINFKYMSDVGFQINFQASVFLAFVLNVSTFFCTTLNTARTQTVVGQLKNFGAFLLGLLLFDDYIYDPINFAGLLIGFLGGVLYSYVTYAERQKPSPAVTNVGDSMKMVTSVAPHLESRKEADGHDGSGDEEALVGTSARMSPDSDQAALRGRYTR